MLAPLLAPPRYRRMSPFASTPAPARWCARRGRRTGRAPTSPISSREYGLGTAEGVALLCLAEALLRIPDAATADALIEDRIAAADWQSASRPRRQPGGQCVGLGVHADRPRADAGRCDQAASRQRSGAWCAGMGEPVIRTALRRGMRVLARQFVMGRTIERGACARAADEGSAGATASTCWARRRGRTTTPRATCAPIVDAIGAIGRARGGRGPIDGPGISVKLSALHPRYEPLQAARCVPALIAALTRAGARRRRTRISG